MNLVMASAVVNNILMKCVYANECIYCGCFIYTNRKPPHKCFSTIYPYYVINIFGK